MEDRKWQNLFQLPGVLLTCLVDSLWKNLLTFQSTPFFFYFLLQKILFNELSLYKLLYFFNLEIFGRLLIS